MAVFRAKTARDAEEGFLSFSRAAPVGVRFGLGTVPLKARPVHTRTSCACWRVFHSICASIMGAGAPELKAPEKHGLAGVRRASAATAEQQEQLLRLLDPSLLFPPWTAAQHTMLEERARAPPPQYPPGTCRSCKKACGTPLMRPPGCMDIRHPAEFCAECLRAGALGIGPTEADAALLGRLWCSKCKRGE